MSILKEIVKSKQKELNLVKSNKENFKKTFSRKEASIIWEIKLSSPKFDYSDQIDLEEVFKFYWKNDLVKWVSILIDETYFSWDIKRWYEFKKTYKKPTFFKEFVIDKRQIDWANYFWYDALLLLNRVLETKDLIEFINYSNLKNIYPVVEVDTKKDLEEVLEIDLDFAVAINCRNLWTMEIDRQKHFEIYESFEEKLKDKITFAFSWIDNIENTPWKKSPWGIEEYKQKFNWVLIWTYFMKQFIK